MKGLNKKRVLFICSIVVAVFFVLLILGRPFLFPVPPRVSFNSPTGVCFGSDTSIAADQAGERLLLLDNEKKLQKIIQLGDAEEINRAQVLADDGEHFYIAGYKFIKDTDKVSSARIMRMDHDGRNPAVVLEYVNEPGEETNLVLDISADDSSLYIVRDDLAEGTVIVTRYNTGIGSVEDILTTSIPADYTGKYDPKTGTLYVNDYYGRMFKISAGNPEPEQILEDYIVENYIPSKDGGLFWIESGSGNLYKNETLLLEETGAYYVLAPYNDGVAYDSIDDSRLSIPDLDTGAVTHMNGADFSASYLLLSIVCSICIVYLAVLIIILLVRAVRSMYLAGNYVQLKRTGIVVVLIASAVIIALLYTNKIIEIETQHLTEDISLYSHYFAESMDEQLLEDAVYTPEIGKDPEAWEKYLEACGRLEDKYGFFRERLDDNRKNGYLSFYKKMGDKLVLVFESEAVTHIGYQYSYSYFEPMIQSGEVVRFTKPGYNKYHAMAPITDEDGRVIGAAEYGQDYRLTSESLRATCIDMLVKLLSVFATIYIILIELIEFFKNRNKRKMLLDKGEHPHPETAMIRNAMFLFATMEFMDSIVVVFVAKNLLRSSSMQETAFRLALPALMAGIGTVAACFIYNLIAGRFRVRRICLISGISLLVVRVGMFAAVLSGSYAFFCMMKLLADLSSPFLYCIIYTMRVKAVDEKERYSCFKQCSLGRISGIMLGTLISGFFVQDISQSVVMYAASAVLVIPLVLLVYRILPANTIYVSQPDGQKQSASGNFFKFITDKSIIIYFLFAVVPAYLIMGYQGYLFPLYSDAAQMPAMYVTTAFVMSRALLYMMSDSIENMLKRIDHWKTVIFGIALIGIAFLEFAVNPGLAWAMIMLAVTGTAETVVMPAADVLWTRQAKSRGIPLESISSGVTVTQEIICALKETMISVFLLLGNSYACVALGVFCLISITIFTLCTRKSPMVQSV